MGLAWHIMQIVITVTVFALIKTKIQWGFMAVDFTNCMSEGHARVGEQDQWKEYSREREQVKSGFRVGGSKVHLCRESPGWVDILGHLTCLALRLAVANTGSCLVSILEGFNLYIAPLSLLVFLFFSGK